MSTEQLIELNYQEDLHEYYQQLADLPGFMLLESRDKSHGRYDIVTAYPYAQMQYHAESCERRALLDEFATLLRPSTSFNSLPFQGGAIGYVSYDLGVELIGINASLPSFLKALPLLNFGFYDWAIISDHYLKKTTLFAGHQHAVTKDHLEHVVSLWNKKKETPKLVLHGPFNALMSKEYYAHSFQQIKAALVQGRSYQVNFTQPFYTEFNGASWALYNKISLCNPVPYSAFLRFDAEEIISFSPERFLLCDQGNLLTSPIKGSSRRSDELREDEQLKNELLGSKKNRAENVMIVDLLRNDLAKISNPGSVHVLNLCHVQSYHSVHHLVSDIASVSKANFHPLDLFLSCFPCGSITGAPKLEAMRIINELELYARGVYCGSIAYFSRHGRFDSSVAIRTITAKNNILYLAAGGGIVIGSDCDDEYRECYVKLNGIINALR